MIVELKEPMKRNLVAYYENTLRLKNECYYSTTVLCLQKQYVYVCLYASHGVVHCFLDTPRIIHSPNTHKHTHIMYVNTTAHMRQEGGEKERRGCCSTTYALHVCVQ